MGLLAITEENFKRGVGMRVKNQSQKMSLVETCLGIASKVTENLLSIQD